MYRYSIERISCCKDLNQIESKKTLGLALEMLHLAEFCIEVEYI